MAFKSSDLPNRGMQVSNLFSVYENRGYFTALAQNRAGIRTADLLLQAGGFSAIVLDMASLAPESVSRVPLAMWHRYRVASMWSHCGSLRKARTLRVGSVELHGQDNDDE